MYSKSHRPGGPYGEIWFRLLTLTYPETQARFRCCTMAAARGTRRHLFLTK